MAIINGAALESNRKIRVYFDGGNLSSDGGLLLLKEFLHKLDVDSLVRNRFHTTDIAEFRFRKDHENLQQMLYQLRNDPVMTSVVGKPALASQPTLS